MFNCTYYKDKYLSVNKVYVSCNNNIYIKIIAKRDYFNIHIIFFVL